MTPPDRRLVVHPAGRRGSAVRQVAPATPAVSDARYVSLDALRAALEGADWAPLRLAGQRRERPASPRLPHALALHLAQHARELARTAADAASLAATDVDPDLARLEALVGADRAVVTNALEGLERAGVLDRAGQGTMPAFGVRLAPMVLGPAPRCDGLDWRGIATATAGSPSAWVAAHALAERLDPFDWMPVARGGLELALGCGVSGVRGALERLVSADLLERRGQRGGVSVYRFTDAAWGRGRGDGGYAFATSVQTSRGDAHRATVGAVGPQSSGMSGAAPPVVDVAAGRGVRLVLGGVELELPAGCRAQVVVGADGRPTISLSGPDP